MPPKPRRIQPDDAGPGQVPAGDGDPRRVPVVGDGDPRQVLVVGDGGSRRVLVVGDANPDLVLRGDVVPRFGQAEQLLDDADLVIGGSAAITAHAFARLGRPVSLSAAIGTDDFGTFVRTALSAAGVDVTPLLTRPDIPTGLSVILSRGDDRAILTLPGTIPTLAASDVHATLAALRPDVRHLHVSSFFLQPALAADLPALLAAAHDAGLTTSLDTNDDPAGTWHGLTAVLPHVDVLLPNRAEALSLASNADPHHPAAADVGHAAAALAAAGPLVVVKDGADGAFAVTPSGEPLPVPGEPAKVIDTTGAGDTFNAAFLDTWLDGHPLPACLRRAVRAGARSVATAGGTAGQPTAADLPHT
jgi:ribokinase